MLAAGARALANMTSVSASLGEIKAPGAGRRA